VATAPEVIFEEPHLSEKDRKLIAQTAVGVYCLSAYSLPGMGTQPELRNLLSLKRHPVQHAIGYLSLENSEPYIAKWYGSGGRVAYYAAPRLVELVEIGGSSTLTETMAELAQEQAGHDIFGKLYNLDKNQELQRILGA
jgi:hypothetical protein